MDKPLKPVTDPVKPSKLVSGQLKTVRTNTDQQDPDRMEVINTTDDRIRSRKYDARQSALAKLRKTNNTVKEAMEPINELSKKTLGQYVKLAHADGMQKSKAGGDLINSARSEKNIKFRHRMQDIAIKQLDKAGKRQKGINKAINKLTKEDTEVSNLDTMIDAVINKTPGEFKSALSAEMQSRAADLIMNYRQEVAQNMFQPPAEDQEEEQEQEQPDEQEEVITDDNQDSEEN